MDVKTGCYWLLLLAMGVAASSASEPGTTFSSEDIEFFERRVRPLFIEHCYECHSGEAEAVEGGLWLDSRAGVLSGGDTGPAAIPGKPTGSLLIDAVEYGDLYQMPPKAKLPAHEVAVLREWVARGMPWPVDETGGVVRKQNVFDIDARKREHWAWQPIVEPALPEVSNETWPLDPLDRFILARLEAEQFHPAPRASPATLLRRLYFDLIGLPPPVEAVEQFTADPSPEAYRRVVDELLSSPRFGERWGRHWLDLVRYSDSRGHEFDYDIPNAWRYRDYVIRALNSDLSYDQFVTEHLAGDLLPSPRRHPDEGYNESILATGFWHLGDWVHSPVDLRKDEADRFDNAIDVFGKALLGLTVACARCHDHKFDPISQRDYYALAGFLDSSGYQQTRFETVDHNRRVAMELDQLRRDTGRRLGQWLAARAASNGRRLAQLTAGELPLHAQPAIQLAPGTQVVADYDDPGTPWLTDGPAFGAGPLQPGELLPSDDPQAPIGEVVARGHARLRPELAALKIRDGSQVDIGRAAAWGDRAGRVLRTPVVELKSGKLHYLVRGAARVQVVLQSHRLIHGPLHQESFLEIPYDEEVRWIEHALPNHVGLSAHVELSPLDDHPLEVWMVVEGIESPSSENDQPAAASALSEYNAAADPDALADALPELLERLAAGDLMSANRGSSENDLVQLLAWLVANQRNLVAANDREAAALIEQYRTRRKEIVNQLERTSALAPTIYNGPSVDSRLLIRGNVRTPGGHVPRRFLEAVAGGQQPAINSGSGRLELAQRVLDPSNPFPARVMVNRIWHHLMGRGLVASVDNFGVLGEPPTHPELLDHLATRFVREGWSIKQMIGTIVQSQTYQMSSRDDERDRRRDPANRTWRRAEVKRLEGEAIRDALLAVSGRLDDTMYGPSVPLYLTDFLQGRGRPKKNGPLDGHGRRSIYLAVRRNFLSPMMLAFDVPQPAGPTGRRTVSNVPAQALIMMNDEFVAQQARLCAERLFAVQASDDARLTHLYLAVYGRQPAESERPALAAFLEQQQRAHGAAGAEDSALAAWSDLCHVIFNVKEFIYLH